MNITITIEEAHMVACVSGWADNRQDEAFVRSSVASLIERAIQERIDIDDPGPHQVIASPVRAAIYLKAHIAEAVRAVSVRLQRPAPSVCRALIEGVMAAHRGELPIIGEATAAGDHPITRLNGRLKGAHRLSQAFIYDYISRSLHDGRVGFVEAGTGTGKTRAEVAAALDAIARTGESACIAVPTFRVMAQVQAEYIAQSSHRNDAAPLRLVRGRREFVSADLLTGFLRDAPVPVAKKGARLLARWNKPAAHEQTAWLVGTLTDAIPEIPADEVRLTGECDKADPGYIHYRAQFAPDGDEGPPLVVCTHAMLAQDARRRMWQASRDGGHQLVQAEIVDTLRRLRELDGDDRQAALGALNSAQQQRAEIIAGLAEDGLTGILPPYRFLVLDEAHLFEPAVSGAFADRVSLNGVLRLLSDIRAAGGRSVSADLLKRMRKTLTALQDHGEAGGVVQLNSHYSAVARLLQAMVGDIEAVLPKRLGGRNPALARLHERLARTVSVLRASVKFSRNTRGYISFSPHRAFPQVYVGPTSVGNTLSALWASVDGGAAVSATLYTPNTAGASARYHAELLGVPVSRLLEWPSLSEAWTHTPVTMHAPADGPWVLPPSGRGATENATKKWISEVGRHVDAIRQSAAGGVMVLMTSYAAAHALAAVLSGPPDEILVADSDIPLQAQVEAFLDRRQAGRRATWLAVGGAWTGLDVGGHCDLWKDRFGSPLAAADDNVLTDLCIPRIPYGTNQSLSFRWRVENRPSFPWHTLDAYFTFKQGLGRLIRRGGLPGNRRIWVLDGRLADGAAGRSMFWHEIRRYQRIVEVPPASGVPARRGGKKNAGTAGERRVAA